MQHDEIDNIQNGQRLPTLIMCVACCETATVNASGGRLQGGSGDIVLNPGHGAGCDSGGGGGGGGGVALSGPARTKGDSAPHRLSCMDNGTADLWANSCLPSAALLNFSPVSMCQCATLNWVSDHVIRFVVAKQRWCQIERLLRLEALQGWRQQQIKGIDAIVLGRRKGMRVFLVRGGRSGGGGGAGNKACSDPVMIVWPAVAAECARRHCCRQCAQSPREKLETWSTCHYTTPHSPHFLIHSFHIHSDHNVNQWGHFAAQQKKEQKNISFWFLPSACGNSIIVLIIVLQTANYCHKARCFVSKYSCIYSTGTGVVRGKKCLSMKLSIVRPCLSRSRQNTRKDMGDSQVAAEASLELATEVWHVAWSGPQTLLVTAAR